MLVTNSFGSQTFDSPLGRYVRGQSHTTPRSGRLSRSRVPTLAYVPTEETLEFAIRQARGSSLCVVESVGTPVGGWAADVGALDLVSGEPTPPHQPYFAEQLDRLELFGNNVFGNHYGRQGARRVLDDLHRSGLLKRDVVLAALAARGISVRGQKEIAKLIDRIVAS